MITHQIQTDKMTRSVYQPAVETQFTICNTLQLLGNFADMQICLMQSMLPFSGKYVSHVCALYTVFKWQRHDFLQDSHVCPRSC